MPGLERVAELDPRVAGGAFAWVAPFPILCGVGLSIGYALLGASWLVLKSEGLLRHWAYARIPWLVGAMVVVLAVATGTTLDIAGRIAAQFAGRTFGLVFPLVGALAVGDARLELRNALEPWHVLGEEATPTGTARYVDSSLERLELRAIGLDEERYVVAVNGVVLPLRRVAGRDTRVGGVRFRAWAPPHALQPHLGIHHPVHVAVIDTWGKRGVAGGAYHVWHPEGRAFDAAPLTRVEAAARRAQRFTLEAPPAWPGALRRAPAHPDQPYTLDLRRIDAGRPMPKAEDWADGE